MHQTIEPSILYFGTPVVLISTLNEDGSVNVAPMSSVWWLGWSCMIGLDASSQTVENIRRTEECVLNLPSAELVGSVNQIAKTTGRRNVPLHKKVLGYEYEKDKLSRAGFSCQDAKVVAVPRVKECPVQLEARLNSIAPFGKSSPKMSVPTVAMELSIECVHVQDHLLLDRNQSYIDPDKWHPLIMNFRKFYSTGNDIHPSKLAEGDEAQYAPWKQRKAKRWLMETLLSFNTRKYRG